MWKELGQLAPIKSGRQGPEAARRTSSQAHAWIDTINLHELIFSVLPTTRPRPTDIALTQHDRISAKGNSNKKQGELLSLR